MATSRNVPLLTKHARAARNSVAAMSAKYMIVTQPYRRNFFYGALAKREISDFTGVGVHGGFQRFHEGLSDPR